MANGAEQFYESFSAAVGLRDWTLPNPRHEHLRSVLGDVLEDRRGMKILDVGCGAGVLASRLARHGSVDGVDLSSVAVETAGLLVPEGRFRAGRLEDHGLDGPYDLVTIFDVLEHVRRAERREFLAGLCDRLAPGGLLLASTPQGAFTRWLLAERPELAQAVEVEVHLADVLEDARGLGLELVRYETFEVEYARQYQVMVFVRSPAAPGGPPRPPRRLRRRIALAGNPPARVVRRLRPALRLGRTRGPRVGLRMLFGRVPSGRPDDHLS